MAEDTKYNGWTNYETWAANLWLDGMTLEELIDPSEYASDSDDWRMISYAADALKEYVEEFNPLADEATMYSDLLNASIRAIDYREIVEHYVEDWRYDNPREGTKNSPKEYTVEPAFPSASDNCIMWWGESSEDHKSFWSAFNSCIQHAIDNEYESIVVHWLIVEADIIRWTHWRNNKADQLIQTQSARSTKESK